MKQKRKRQPTLLDFKLHIDPDPRYEDLRRYYISCDGRFRIHPRSKRMWSASALSPMGWDYYRQHFHTLKQAKAFCNKCAMEGLAPMTIFPMRYDRRSGCHVSACRQIFIRKNSDGWAAGFSFFKAAVSKEVVQDYKVRHGLEQVATKSEILQRLKIALETDPILNMAVEEEPLIKPWQQRTSAMLEKASEAAPETSQSPSENK